MLSLAELQSVQQDFGKSKDVNTVLDCKDAKSKLNIDIAKGKESNLLQFFLKGSSL